MRTIMYLGAVLVFILWECTVSRSDWTSFAIAVFLLGMAIFTALDNIANNTRKSDK